jgi:hypothetical protein
MESQNCTERLTQYLGSVPQYMSRNRYADSDSIVIDNVCKGRGEFTGSGSL